MLDHVYSVSNPVGVVIPLRDSSECLCSSAWCTGDDRALSTSPGTAKQCSFYLAEDKPP